jgi:thermitase
MLPVVSGVQLAMFEPEAWTLSYRGSAVSPTVQYPTFMADAISSDGVSRGYKSTSAADSNRVDHGYAELVIGLDKVQQNHCSDIMDLIASSRGELVKTLVMDRRVAALVAKVPVDAVSAFVLKAKLSKWATYVEPNVDVKADFTPNDPYWSKQWGPAKIQADFAWNTTTGNASILVAEVDTGIDWSHPDLASNYVPLGYDWVNNDPHPMDDNGHGTHVAGTIAAAINNGIGIAGLANVRIMAEKVLDQNGSGTASDVAQGIIHAVESGAKIINLSLGASFNSEVMYEAVKYAFDHGVLVVAAAGNDASSVKQYPAGYDEVVAVSATSMQDSLASFSNHGDWIDVAAPGVNIYSTINNNSYAYMSGTSMASPHVAGVAALIWSRFPNMTRDHVWAQLQYTADDLGTPGFDVYYGFGRVNARRGVEQAPADHDLLVLRMRAPSYVKLGTEAIVNTTILNMGSNNESDVTVKLLVNGTVVDSSAIGFLTSGASEMVSLSWNAKVEGDYNVTTYVVPVTGETSLRNNAFSTQVKCSSPRFIRVPNDYNTIQRAVNAANEGDTILVASGTYHETIQIVTSGLTLVGEDRNNTIIDGGGKDNVVSVTADDVEIDSFTIQNGGRDNAGILLLGSNANTINNTAVLNNTYGIFLDSSPYTTARNNTMMNNTYNFGLYGESVTDFVQTIDSSNTVDGKPIYYLVNQRGTSVPLDAGYVAVVNSTDINVEDLSLNGNFEGVLFAYTADSFVQHVNASDNSIGIYLYESTNNSISNCSLMNSNEGIRLASSNNNTVGFSKLSHNDFGLDMVKSYNDSANHLEAFNNTYGVCLDMSGNNSLRSNNMTSNRFNFGVIGTQLVDLVNDVDTSNTVDGKPVYYWVNQLNKKVPKDAGYVAAVNCANITVAQLDITKNVQGILFASTINSTISESSVAQNDQDGIALYSSDSNAISANELLGNGIGVGIIGSDHNTVYHNNFMGNGEEALCYNSTNLWDDGYPSGGNYWINYTGLDLRKGVYQNETGIDGIGDTANVIDGNNIDEYPLMRLYAGPHDVGIRSVNISKAFVGKGYTANMNIVAMNYGEQLEIFNLTVDAGSSATQTQTLALTVKSGTTITFLLNTTGWGYGNQTVSVHASPVLGETDIADNSYSGWIVVTIPGDINGDGTVNVLDAVVMSKSFIATPSSPNWNPNADINNDGVVNILDAIIVSMHFLQHYP